MTFAQTLRIDHIRLGPDGRIVLQHRADTNFYYILLRGDQVTAILTAKDMQFGTVGTNELKDPNLAANAAFYRVQQVPLSAPLDNDRDGIDDVCELKYRPLLDPLNPNDATLDPDADGRTTLEECRNGTHPFIQNLPEVTTISYPTNSTTASFVIFSGVATTNTLIRVEGGAAYVTNAVDSGGAFEVTVPLNPNRLNRLFVSAVDESGVSSPPVPIDILQDSVAPFLFVDFPTNGMVLTTETTLVAGRVGDALSGFLGLNVTVNGQSARVDVGIGPNGTYERGLVPLNPGTNELTVVAMDRLGNSITRRVTVTRALPAGPRLLALSGDLQETNILRRLPEPLAVKVTESNGNPLANRLVTFEVTRSDGRLLPVNTNQLAADITKRPDYSSNGTMVVQLFTDANGEARVWWRMGTDAGHANNRITVSSKDVAETVYFCASATALPAKQINIGSGNNQRGETLGHAPEPLKVWVSDGNNPVAGVPVSFRVVQGGGAVIPIVAADGASPSGPALRGSRPTASIALKSTRTKATSQSSQNSEVTVLTSLTGHAEVDFTFGTEPGNQIVEATFPGNNGLPATFNATALARVPGQPTSFVGLIRDNAVKPIGRAYCELTVAGALMSTFSDAQGRFAFLNIPSGTGHLYVNGGTANTLGTNGIPTNTFPSLQYTIAVVPNAENALPTPVLLPRLNPINARWYYGTNDLVVTCRGIAGLKMTITANSMKHPTGELVTPGRPALVSLNQVHHDDIPMPMPDGASPPFAWTLQPGGATFDPPVQVEYPNMSGLAPGAAAYFLTFNHDTERFEIVASGRVRDDGSKIVTDPGTGLPISGWGCNCPPYAVSGDCEGRSEGACDPPFIGPCNLGEHYTSCGCVPDVPPNADDGVPPDASGNCPPGYRLLADGNCYPDTKTDSDGDGRSDYDETQEGTNPSNPDSDGDGWSDGEEVTAGTNPKDPLSEPPPGDCLSRGTLTYDPPDPQAQVVGLGQSIAFAAPTVRDSGGTKINSGTGNPEVIPSVAPSYRWILYRNGSPIFDQPDDSTSKFTPSVPGIYTCRFVVSANRECAPIPVSIPVGSAKVIAAEVLGSVSVTREQVASYVVTLTPPEATADYFWTFRGGGQQITEQTGRNNHWSGAIVVSGTIQVRAFFTGGSAANSISVVVNPRQMRNVEDYQGPPSLYSGSPQAEGQGRRPKHPRAFHELGMSEVQQTSNERLDVLVVPSGPNKGMMIYTELPTITYITVVHLSEALSDPANPFYIAQGHVGQLTTDVGQLTINQAIQNVRVHEGLDRLAGYHSHWSQGYDYVTTHPLAPDLEDDIAHSSSVSVASFINAGVAKAVLSIQAVFQARQPEPQNVHRAGDHDFGYPEWKQDSFQWPVGRVIVVPDPRANPNNVLFRVRSGGFKEIRSTGTGLIISPATTAPQEIRAVSPGSGLLIIEDMESDTHTVPYTVVP